MARQALRQLYPKHTLLVLFALLLSTGLLFKAFSLPLLYSQKIFWRNTYSVWTGVVALWEQHEFFLAGILFFFSIVFPIAKLLCLSVVWMKKLPGENRARLLQWLGLLGKWSMLDVFIVAILIVVVKIGPLVKVEPRVGVYVFAAAIGASMLTTMYIERLAKHSLRARPS